MCTRCVMDTTDPDISFDENRICIHCKKYDEALKKTVFTGEVGTRKLSAIVQAIKSDGRGKEYDSILGVSGGVDSTFAAYKAKEIGLRPLAVHLDNGWDSELAVQNIEITLKKLGIDLYTHVIDWEEFKDLQLSFLKASTPDSEIPSDHAIVSLMDQMADKIGVKYVIAGMNTRTESHLPKVWSQGHWDWGYIKSVHKLYGKNALRTFPHTNIWNLYRCRFAHQWVRILDYVDYVKRDALKILTNELGWRYYGTKHYESIYTRFYQGYILPKKFGFDKRKTHFSSLICSGEMTRDEALKELKKEIYPVELQEEDRAYVIKKLCLTEEEFEKIMQLPRKAYWDYPSYGRLFKNQFLKGLSSTYKRIKCFKKPLFYQ